MATKKNKSAKGSKTAKTIENTKGARDRRREVPLTKPAEGSKLAREIAALSKLTKTQLWKKHRDIFGTDSRSCNTKQLVDVIARRLVERANEKSRAPKAPPAEVSLAAPDVATPASASHDRDPRLPEVGTVIAREHKGKVHKVKVLDDGFEYEGKKYRSLSGLAKEITGAIWNGWVWFGIAKRPAKNEASHAA
jgi:hypothetical protein